MRKLLTLSASATLVFLMTGCSSGEIEFEVADGVELSVVDTSEKALFGTIAEYERITEENDFKALEKILLPDSLAYKQFAPYLDNSGEEESKTTLEIINLEVIETKVDDAYLSAIQHTVTDDGISGTDIKVPMYYVLEWDEEMWKIKAVIPDMLGFINNDVKALTLYMEILEKGEKATDADWAELTSYLEEKGVDINS